MARRNNRNIAEMARYIQAQKGLFQKAMATSVLKITLQAEAFAKKNATQQFVGRNNRKLTGQLLNSIFSSFKIKGNGAVGYIGTRGIPYGRIHEYGGDIHPVKAKWLWIKQWGGAADKFRRLTPREFVEKMKEGDKRFKISRKGPKGKVAFYQELRKEGKGTVLFALAKHVKIKERPYLRPAIEDAVKQFPKTMNEELIKNLRGK